MDIIDINFTNTNTNSSSLGAVAGVVSINHFPLNNIKVWLSNCSSICTYTYTDKEGEFLFYNLLDDSYKIKICAEGFVNFEKKVIIRDGCLINLEFPLTAKSNNNILYGKVTDKIGQSVSNAFIGVYTNHKLIKATQTDESGHFVLTNLDKRKYIIKAVTDTLNVTYTIE